MARKKHSLSDAILIYNDYKSNCRRRNIFWDLTPEDVDKIIFENCHYCGSKPSNNRKGLAYNGMDRIDHNKGYTKANILPCCKDCNFLRSSTYTVEETKIMVEALLKFRLRKSI